MTTREEFLNAIKEKPEDKILKQVFADWLEERGEPKLAEVYRHGEPVIEIDLEFLRSDYDWEEVFGEGSNGSPKTDACPPTSDVDTSSPLRGDIVEIIAAVNGANDGPDWVGIFKHKDGRYVLAYGGCDYTGWG